MCVRMSFINQACVKIRRAKYLFRVGTHFPAARPFASGEYDDYYPFERTTKARMYVDPAFSVVRSVYLARTPTYIRARNGGISEGSFISQRS